jgi:hypothetical protein
MPGTCKQAVPGSADMSNTAIRIMKLKSKLVETYTSIRNASPSSRVYVVGYPIFVSDRIGDTTDLAEGGTCRFNVRLDYSERRLVVEGVKYMNTVIKAAAKEAGIVYVDIENLLEGKNLCSGAELSDYAVNGATAGNDIDFKICIFRTGCLGKETFHPNQKAHSLYVESMMKQTNDFSTIMAEPEETTTPIPGSFFGDAALYESININNDGDNSIVIPEPRPFLSIVESGANILQDGLLPGSKLRVELQSTPTTIAEFVVPESGEVNQLIQLPENAEPGVHEIHLFGTTSLGQEIDYYEQIMVAVSETDFDGDGILDEEDSCQTLPNSFIDEDADGIDDACDGDISQLAQETVPEQETEPSEPNIPPQEQEDIIKGQPNPETVAGNEEIVKVLGANSDSNVEQSNLEVLAVTSEHNLVNTGFASLIGVALGSAYILLVVILKKYSRKEKYSYKKN